MVCLSRLGTFFMSIIFLFVCENVVQPEQQGLEHDLGPIFLKPAFDMGIKV